MNNAGRIGFLVRGEYDSSATYDYLDVVLFGNSSYVAKKTTIGNEPAEDNEYWQILAKTPDSTVTGVKGNAEAEFRKGDINITPENIGALPSDGTAASAVKLSKSSTIDGVVFDGSADISHYGTCTTESAAAEKTVSIPGLTLTKGAVITVYFSNENTAPNTTLNVNGLGARTIHYNGAALTSENSSILSGYCEFAYNGAYWYIIGNYTLIKGNAESTYRTSQVNITPANIGLGNVDNTRDANKSVAYAANADTVDGKHASDFAASSHSHTSADITDKLDSTTASALSTSNKLVTERDVYNGLPKINNKHNYDSDTNIYAPLSGGNVGYELVGNGENNAPIWKGPNFGVCETEGSSPYKTVTIDGFKLLNGVTIRVKFTHTNEYDSGGIYLNVSDTGNIPITRSPSNASYKMPKIPQSNAIYEFTLCTVSSFRQWIITGGTEFHNAINSTGQFLVKTGIDTAAINSYYFGDTEDKRVNGLYPINVLENNKPSLGTPMYNWQNLYLISGEITTSDRNEKKEIKDLSELYEKLFLKLQPKSYIFKNGTRIHIGAISQDVEDAMNEIGLTSIEFGGFCKDQKYKLEQDENGQNQPSYIYDEEGNPEYTYSLRYEEFIFLTIHMVQKNIKKIEELEERISALESIITSSERAPKSI